MLAAGVKPAQTREERLYERAAWADYFFRSYGWDWETLQRQPMWLVQRLPEIGAIHNEIAQEQAG